MSCGNELDQDCCCEVELGGSLKNQDMRWDEGYDDGCMRRYNEISNSDSVHGSTSSMDILNVGAGLHRPHCSEFRQGRRSQKCRVQKKQRTPSSSSRIEVNPRQYNKENPNSSKKKQRKQSNHRINSAMSKNIKQCNARCFSDQLSPDDWGSGDHPDQPRTNNRLSILYPALLQSNNRNAGSQQKEIFPFKSTASGNYKLTPNQVVYESKNLSIVAADPEMVSLNVTDEPSVKEVGDNLPSKKLDSNWTTTCLFTTVDAEGRAPLSSETSETYSEAEGASHEPLGKPSELSLARMGYVTDNCIDWDSFQLPKKSDLQKMLLQNILNRVNPDIQVKIGSEVYKCHKIVLQCYCSHFNSSTTSVYELPEVEVSKDVFNLIYRWMLHTSTDSYKLLRRDNILDVYKAVHFLKVKELEDQCWAFMDNVEIFNEDKAFILYLDARKHSNKDIMELMVPRIQRFFLTLVSSKEFVEFTFEEVCIFLKSNYICVHSEMEVFMAAVRWLSHDWSQRRHHAIDVMKCVRFGFINPQILITIRRNPQSPEFQRIANIPEVSQMIDDGVALMIARFYYENEPEEEFLKNLKSLGLTVPVPRNWSGTDKNYCSYQDFLRDLAHYRSKQRLEKKQSKIKMQMDRVNLDEFLSSAVLPPDSQKKIQQLRNGKCTGSSLLRCLPQMDPQEVEFLKKLICKDNSSSSSNSQQVKKQLCSMAEEEYSKSDQLSYAYRDSNETNPQEIEEQPISIIDERDEAARKIQRAYRTYSRRKIKSSLETTQSQQLKMKSSKKRRSDLSLPAGLLRSATHPSAKCDEDGLPLEPSRDAVYIFGGANPFDFDANKNSQRIFQYQTRSNCWRQCGYMPEPLFYHCALYFLGKIYVVGGKNPSKLMKEKDVISKKVWRFEPSHKRWVSLSNMIHARRSFALVACKNKVFAIGGRDERDRILSSVEMYDVNSDHWELVRPLHQARCGAAACELDGRIWVAGGIINHDNVATSSVEYYNFEHNMWINSANLRFTFAYSVLLPVKGKMYLIGGTIGLKDQAVTGSGKQIDVWDPKNQTWDLSSMMSKPRHGHAAVYLRGQSGSGQVLIMGGMSTKHKSVMQSTECWRLHDDHWVLGVAPIPYSASGLAALTMPSEIFT